MWKCLCCKASEYGLAAGLTCVWLVELLAGASNRARDPCGSSPREYTDGKDMYPRGVWAMESLTVANTSVCKAPKKGLAAEWIDCWPVELLVEVSTAEQHIGWWSEEVHGQQRYESRWNGSIKSVFMFCHSKENCMFDIVSWSMPICNVLACSVSFKNPMFKAKRRKKFQWLRKLMHSSDIVLYEFAKKQGEVEPWTSESWRSALSCQ